MKFATKLITIFTSLMLLTVTTFFLFVYVSNTETLTQLAYDSLMDNTVHTMNEIDMIMNERSGDLRVFASAPVIRSRNSTPEQITNRLIEFRNGMKAYVSLSFFDVNRTRVADTAGLNIGKQDDVAGYWNDLLEGKQSLGGDIMVSEELNIPVIHFAAPVKDTDGKLRGYIVSRMPLTKINEIIEAVGGAGANERLYVDLVDADGLLLFSNHNQKGVLKDTLTDWESFKRASAGELSGVIAVHSHPDIAGGQKTIASFAKEGGYFDFAGNGWTLTVHVLEKDALAPATKLRNDVITLLLATLCSFITATLVFSDSITKPMRKLQMATEEVENGNYAVRVDINTRDEMAQLGRAFNKTAAALERVDEERKEIDKIKTQFMSITSHELRSPITPIKAQSQMLLWGYFGKLNKDQKESVDIILKNTLRLDTIIQDFLEISRIEAARLKFNFVKVNLAGHIMKLKEEMDELMPEKRITVVSEVAKLPKIETDPDRLLQVLRNLVNNAKKFSPEGSEIFIKAEVQGDFILFSVKDSGIGIKPEDAGRIFEPFFQAEKTMYREYGGIGLGLAICRGIVEAQNGRIWFKSAPGKGTTFYFTLPLTPVREMKPIRILFSEQAVIENKIESVFNEILGPVGKTEFNDLKTQKRIVDEGVLTKYVTELVKNGIITEKKGEEFEDRMNRIINVKEDNEGERVKIGHNKEQ